MSATINIAALAAAQKIGWDEATKLIGGAVDGNLLLHNHAEDGFGLLQLGGATDAFPAIKRNGAGIDIRLADDSALAALNSALHTVTRAGIGATSTAGVLLTNTTAAAAGAQQWSPAIQLTGQGWKTDATAASQAVDWRIETVPVQAASAASSALTFSSQVNAGGYNSRATLSAGGFLRLSTGGSNSTPTIAIGDAGSSGLYSAASNQINLSGNGTLLMTAGGTVPRIIIVATNGLGFVDGGGNTTFIYAEASNTLAQRNGTNAQAFRVYNTFTDASNYERAALVWAGNDAYLETRAAGTGSPRNLIVGTVGSASLDFMTSGTSRWRANSSGHFLAVADNTYDIGASGATRPRTGYFGTSVVVGPATIRNVAGATTGAALRFDFPESGLLDIEREGTLTGAYVIRGRSSESMTWEVGSNGWSTTPQAFTLAGASGSGANIAGANLSLRGGVSTGSAVGGAIVLLTVPAGGAGSTRNSIVERMRITPDGLITLGGTTSSFPALKRSSTTIQVRLADDSAFASVQGKLTTEANAVDSVPTPDHYLTLYDASGAAYRVPAELVT